MSLHTAASDPRFERWYFSGFFWTSGAEDGCH